MVDKNNPELILKEVTALRSKEEADIAKSGLLEFTKHTKPDYQVGNHHKILCDYLDDFLNNPDFNRLIIELPPRHGKSELVSRRLPAYVFGKNPDINIISCSYGSDLAQMMNRDVQRVIDKKNYSEVFPETKLSSKNVKTDAHSSCLRNSDTFEIVGHKGSYRGAGVGGAITGMGFDIGIIDDPCKNAQEANSPTVREHVWEWWGSTFYTRAEKDAKILITLTRWHEDDLAGRLINQAKEDPEAEQWKVLKFSAIYEGPDEYTPPEDTREIGEALWGWKYNLKKLQKIKKAIGSYFWNALYQQSPSPASGSIFKREWWKYYTQPPSKFDMIIQSWDFTFKGEEENDYVVGQIWGKLGADRYLLDQVRAKLSFTEAIKTMLTFSAKWQKAKVKLIEDKANGPAVIDTLKTKVSGLIPVNPEGDKTSRARAVSPEMEAGNVYIPDPLIAPWIHDYIEEFVVFPKGKNDDQVDATTQALNWLYKKNKIRVPDVEEAQEEVNYNREW